MQGKHFECSTERGGDIYRCQRASDKWEGGIPVVEGTARGEREVEYGHGSLRFIWMSCDQSENPTCRPHHGPGRV
jgi:hypothetical protein